MAERRWPVTGMRPRLDRALRSERGSAVAEFAIALPAVLLVVSLAIGGVQVGALQVQAQDAAADAARSFARGESGSVVAARLHRQVPGASVSRSADGDLVCARVSVVAGGPIGRFGLRATASSCALARGL